LEHGFRWGLVLGKRAAVIHLGGKDALFSFRTPPHFALGQLPLPATAFLNFPLERRGLFIPQNPVFEKGGGGVKGSTPHETHITIGSGGHRLAADEPGSSRHRVDSAPLASFSGAGTGGLYSSPAGGQ
jgi:hypothetical protein